MRLGGSRSTLDGGIVMLEKDNVHFFDTSGLSETPGIRGRCNADYLTKALKARFPDEEFTVTRAEINDTGKYKSNVNILVKLLWAKTDLEGLPPFCHVVINHKTGTAEENIIIWSPLAWNDRFAGTAGGGSSTGSYSHITVPNNVSRGWTIPYALINGFTAAITDAGNEACGNNWGQNQKTGEIYWDRIENWRARSTHNMTVFGKAVAQILHDRPVKYAYMNGGSGGGRQSMAEAQEFPEDYDGIWACCPAINWAKFIICGFWPQAVMRSYGYPLHPQKLEYFADALQNSVGGADAYYRLERHPVAFDPFTLVGQKSKAGVITQTDAEIMQKIWEGPRRKDGTPYWFGFQPGQKNWNKIIPIGWFYYPLFKKWPKPFPLADIWARWVTGDPKQNFDKITMEELEPLFDASSEKFPTCNIDNADLRPFAAHGGKLMIDHGWDDPLIPTMGTIDYYQRMVQIVGGREQADKFCRLYITPGDNHGNCVFVGYNKEGFPAYASVRTTLTDKKFRGDAVGSDKSVGFSIKGFDKKKVYVFEAPIDLLSHATLENIKHSNSREWLNSTRLSLGGVSDKALKQFLSDYDEIEEIVFCLDNDPAGIEAAEKYIKKYSDMGYIVSSAPPYCKDYNEELQQLIKKGKAVTLKV